MINDPGLPWAGDQTHEGTLQFIRATRAQIAENNGFQAAILDGERITERLSAGDTCFIDSTVPHRFLGTGLSPYEKSSAEVIDVYWCPLGESYLFEDDGRRP